MSTGRRPRLLPPRVRLLGRVAGKAVYTVDGERVRNDIHTDFTMGGSPVIYKLIPDGEIWIDGAMSSLDITATILHEAVEYRHMTGRGLSYDKAHDIATAEEAKFRRRHQGLDRVDLNLVRKALVRS